MSYGGTPTNVTFGQSQIRTRSSVSPSIRIVGRKGYSDYGDFGRQLTAAEPTNYTSYGSHQPTKQFRDIAYEHHPLVEQDEYYRKVVTHPGVQYQVPLHNEIMRDNSAQGWVRAVHYPVATEMYRQVPFKTEYIEKTQGKYYPESGKPATQVKPESASYEQQTGSKFMKRSVDMRNELDELNGLLSTLPGLASETNELYGERFVDLAIAPRHKFHNYPNKTEVDKVVDDILNKLEIDTLQETVLHTIVEKKSSSGVHNVNGSNYF